MKHIRIGKDIRLQWTITTAGAAISLQGRDLTLEMKSPIGKVIILPYRLEGNVLNITYYGYEQNVVGEYSLTLWENKGKPGQNVVDAIRAFKLVRTSPEEEDFTGGDLQVESVDLGTANLEILSGGGASTPGGSPDLSALEGKVAANTASISNINEELDTVKQVQDGHNNSITQINNTLEEHADSIAHISSEQTEQNNRLSDHEERLGHIDATISSHTESINGINNTLANHDAQIDNAAESIESTNSALSALQGKVDANTTSISKINEELDTVKEVQDVHNNSISQISTTLQEIKAEQTEQNNRLNNHEERLVYTESDLLKVREEYDGIISELVKSIGHTQKAFVVETNDREVTIYIDAVETIIPPNSCKGFIFRNEFRSGIAGGIASFRLLVTKTSDMKTMANMFSGCSSLTSLDVSGFDTHAVKNMENMFSGCSSLTSIDVSSFDISNVTSMYSMFRHCRSLTSLDLSNFDTSSVTNMGIMFVNCLSLTSLLLGTNFFKTSAVTSIDFSYCSKWTNETVVTSLVTNSYDRAAAELNTLTLKLHANTKAALTDEQKATITSKGYTIA